MQRSLSGIQASGQPSLGNLLGAIRPQIALQEKNDAYYFIADHHAITVRQNPTDFREQIYAIAAWYLAAGLDPAKATLFIQSHVPAHVELGWILQTFTQMGELERMTQFKDKSARHAENINAGLFTYPALQAADILLYQPDVVPVGEDQRQHIELCRDIATRFNGVYGDVFKIPEGQYPKYVARVKDLQHPEKKMSKSEDTIGTIFLLDEPSAIVKKIKKAVTDTLGVVAYVPEQQPGVSNLLAILGALKNVTPEEAATKFKGQGYGPFKQAIADALIAEIEPIQQTYKQLIDDKAALLAILKTGAEKADIIAQDTLHKVKEAVGFVL